MGWNSQKEILVSAGQHSLPRWENARDWEKGANTDHLVHRGKWGSFMEENTVLLKSTHIEEATRKPKCIGDAWQEGYVLPSSFCLFQQVFLIFHNIFCGRRAQVAWKHTTKVV